MKLALSALQGELATALFIYTMNLYDLLEKYTWEGVKAYHFQFHRKRVAGGRSIYHPEMWRHLDSELIASKCFAHPAPVRSAWNTSQSRASTFRRTTYDLPIRENLPAISCPLPQTNPISSQAVALPDRRVNTYTPGYRSTTAVQQGNTSSIYQPGQACRNWNYRECRSTNCRYQHVCTTCGSNHKSTLCSQTSNGNTQQGMIGRYGR